MNLIFNKTFFNQGSSNILGLSVFVGFFILFFSFSLSILAYVNILTPFFDVMKNLLNLFFGFLITNFFDFDYFYGFVNYISIGLFGLLSFYLVFRLISKFGKLL